MSIALLVMTDGRDECLDVTLRNALIALVGPITQVVIHDDTGDADHRTRLAGEFPDATVIGADERLGFGGAVRNAWAHLRTLDVDWVFWLEDDFLITRAIPLKTWIDVMEARPYLAQIALERQPWNEREREAGGILEQHPGAWTFHQAAGDWLYPQEWREHRLFFTTNPCLIRRSLLDREWPEGAESEGHFGIELFSDPDVRSAFWGRGQWCEHIGEQRVGVGY